MDQIPLNKLPESKKPQLIYDIEVLALAFAMPGAVSLYSVSLWALTNDLGLTKCFPWSGGPLLNWMIWLGLAMALNAVAANTYPTRTWAERQRVPLNRFSRFGSLLRQEEQQIAGQLALGGK